MMTNYESTFPISTKPSYIPNDTVDFAMSLENKKLLPNTVFASFHVTALTGSPSAPVAAAETIMADRFAGDHSFIKNLSTTAGKLGKIETIQNYPRLVKMKTMATEMTTSLGTETSNCLEGKCASNSIRRGYELGQANPYIYNGAWAVGARPVCLKLESCVNKFNAPVAGDQVGNMVISFQLPPPREVFYGDDVDATTTYIITNLRLNWQTVADDGSRPELFTEVYQENRRILESNEVSITTFVPGVCDSVHMSFVALAVEGELTQNYLLCMPIPGDPQQATGPTGAALSTTDLQGGAERLFWGINDTDTALVGFTMETRPEMLWNYLRSFNNEPSQYSVTHDRNNCAGLGDGYGLGINFGGPLDFTKQSFSCRINSKVNNAIPFVAYLYFRTILNVK